MKRHTEGGSSSGKQAHVSEFVKVSTRGRTQQGKHNVFSRCLWTGWVCPECQSEHLLFCLLSPSSLATIALFSFGNLPLSFSPVWEFDWAGFHPFSRNDVKHRPGPTKSNGSVLEWANLGQ